MCKDQQTYGCLVPFVLSTLLLFPQVFCTRESLPACRLNSFSPADHLRVCIINIVITTTACSKSIINDSVTFKKQRTVFSMSSSELGRLADHSTLGRQQFTEKGLRVHICSYCSPAAERSDAAGRRAWGYLDPT